MCGILLSIQEQEHITDDFEKLWEQLKLANAARGPDAQDCIETSVDTDAGAGLKARFFASELRLRGDKLIVQPHVKDGNILCFNGEIFEGLELDASENDGVKLFQLFATFNDLEQDLRNVLQTIEGPYAFTYYHARSARLYFARDPLGRRSLLLHKPSLRNPYFLIASTSIGAQPQYELEEVSTEYIHCLDLRNLKLSANSEVTCPVRSIPRCGEGNKIDNFATPARVNKTLESPPSPISSLSQCPDGLLQYVDDLVEQLSRSVYLRVRNIPYHGEKGYARVAVLFSGGIDSTILAFFADRHLPQDEPIDLLNVAFENPRKTALRLDGENPKRKNKRNRDSTAQLLGEFDSYLVPDRITGLEELEELRKLCPKRQWNFVEVDVTYDESSKAQALVEALMFPGQTVMDLSLALALYFASKAEGSVRSGAHEPRSAYKSPARVLLNGLGSDELLGGYGRHRTSFKVGGWSAVVDELQLELERIPTRNLGRDDRIISSHGKEARHPFLSLSVVNFISKLPIHTKVDPRLPLGVGDKMLLRLAAAKIGLLEASQRKKKAMQFGSHSARMKGGEGEKRGDILLSR